MTTRYDYKSVEEFIEDRSLASHVGLKAAINNELLFGQILRNVMKHAFLCGEFSKGDATPDAKYE